jgi:aspartate racemase
MFPRLEPVGVLGGMGPAAGADFLREFVRACVDLMTERGIPVSDQNFPEHWLAQVPVPDRSTDLLHDHEDRPLQPMLQAVGRLSALGVGAIAIACNTAHAWHRELQARFPHVEVLHVAREVAASLQASGVTRCGLLATEGTYRTGLYPRALRRRGIDCHAPTPDEQRLLMRGIYDGVKAGRLEAARADFEAVALALARRHGLQALILGCTEIPLALRELPTWPQLQLVDPAPVLARALARRAYRRAPSRRPSRRPSP